MASVFNAVKAFVLSQGLDRTYWVAYSGGMDSHVLLHVMAAVRADYPDLALRAIHVNHALSPDAAAWTTHCEKVSRQLAVPFQQVTIDLQSLSGKSLEEMAREKRYAVFAEKMAEHDVLLTAHHEDDQAETVLLQLFRGAGPKGLAAMPSIKPFATGYLARPLLSLSRAQLIEYAVAHQLAWVEDASNHNVTLARNFLRHDIIPLLTHRWPSIANTLSRVANHCAEAQRVIDDAVSDVLCHMQGSQENTLSVKKLLSLDESKRGYVLRAWLAQQSLSVPSTVKMQQLLGPLLLARPDRFPHVMWGRCEVRRYQDNIYAMHSLADHNPNQTYTLCVNESLLLPGIGTLRVTVNDLGCAEVDKLTVRFRQGGEVCRLPGRKHHHALKNLFQMWGVPPWQRDRIPLIYLDDTLIAVVGYFVAEAFAAYGFDLLPEHKYLTSAPNAKIGNDTSKKSRNTIKRIN